MNRLIRGLAVAAVLSAPFVLGVRSVGAHAAPGSPEAEGFQELVREGEQARAALASGRRPAGPTAIPDVFGPGAVLAVGNVYMKSTNWGLDGNPFPNVSSDPSGQWPGASGVEYLSYIGIVVGAVNPLATDPNAVRRVSFLQEFRPPTLDPEDRMYRAYDGIVNGARFVNDDGDTDPLTGEARIDEDFLDGRDNDGDGAIDEDYGAIGQQMYTCVMRDDTPQAINAAAVERHVPLGIEIHKAAWAYSIPGYQDFNVIQYDIYNVSGHTLDSVVVAFRTDMDCGPLEKADYYSDDYNLPFYPQGDFIITTKPTDPRLQPAADHRDVGPAFADSALCPRYKLRVQGYSAVDDDGDEGKTPGVATFMLVDHTIDPTGENGPTRVGFRAFRSFASGTPYTQGGNPGIDQQRYELMTSTENIDPATGFITLPVGELKSDYSDWACIGPWLHLAAGGHLQATVAFGVRRGSYLNDPLLEYQTRYLEAVDPDAGGVTNGSNLLATFPTLDNALSAQIAFEGVYERRDWPVLPDDHGREYCVKAPPGTFFTLQGCADRDLSPRLVTDRRYECFDMDCDYCTGAFSVSRGGLFHRTWLAEAPPPSPNTNLSVGYNFSDNPDRRFIPAGDGKVTLAWDNLSETTVDPKSAQFDFRGYRIWKVSNWSRPVGSGGPSEDDWTLLAEYRMFDRRDSNRSKNQCPPESIAAGVCDTSNVLCPLVYIPRTGTYQRICLDRGDLWDKQSGNVIHPDPSVLCLGWPNCVTESGFDLGQSTGGRITRVKYPVGRYRFTDADVKNGFVYFYSVTAFDSSGSGDQITELHSRRSAVESEGIVPQAAADTTTQGKHVWVVPNPYRGARLLKDRPSAWDLTPNASDPTGTHVDFFGLPRGNWKIRIFTVSGDLVEELNSRDAVNESIRSEITDPNGVRYPGYNRQQDNPNDGQARWNLISRNGQDVVSGIYLFTVELGGSVRDRGKFVIIR